MPTPEQAPAEYIQRILSVGRCVIEVVGTETKRWGVQAKVAQLSARETMLVQHPEAVSPTLMVAGPIGSDERSAPWSMELMYAMEYSSTTRHILISNEENPYAKMSFYNGNSARPLDVAEPIAVAQDLMDAQLLPELA